MSAPEDRLFLFATIRPKPEHFSDAREALERITPQTLAEPGCHVFCPFISRDDPHVLHLFECFEDEAALQRHYGEAYTRDVFERYGDWLAAPVEVRKLRISSPQFLSQFF